MPDPTNAAARRGAVERWSAVAREKWRAIAPDAPERLVGPGSPSFRCQPNICDALCCGAPYLAGTSERDVAGLREAGEETIHFLDIDPGELTELFDQGQRWSQIVTLRQESGRCVFLQDERRCGVYGQRPDGCALFPYRIVFVPREEERIAVTIDSVEAMDRSVRIALGWTAGGGGFKGSAAGGLPEYVPLVLRDMSCPGFTEAPMGSEDYAALLERIWELDACTSHAWPCDRHEHLA